MAYQVWIEEYEGSWKKSDCEDKAVVKEVVFAALKEGREVLVTIEVPFSLKLEIGQPGEEPKKPKIAEPKVVEVIPEEVPTGEVNKSKAKPDKSSRG